MQGIMETSFDIIYLVTVISIGALMIKNGKSNNETKLFGIMAVVLGFGDSFHLVPRAYALLTTGLEANAAALGIGKFITSITMTIFYVILYHIWEMHYNKSKSNNRSFVIYGLAIIRIILCLFPQNEWLIYKASLEWGIYRNIPFALMGIIIIYLFYMEVARTKDTKFKYMAFAIFLSFGFYIPVVLFADKYPTVGILMIPKTLAYVWIVFMGWHTPKESSITKTF